MDRSLCVHDQFVDLDGVELHGGILDLCGGEEGVIGQYKPEQVVAIDLSRKSGEMLTG